MALEHAITTSFFLVCAYNLFQLDDKAWSRTRCPGPQEEGQPAELLAGQFCVKLFAQGGMFLVLDHLRAQQERLDLAGKAPC